MINLRPAQASDVPAITRIYNEAIRTTTATFDTEPKTVAQQQAWLEAHTDRYPVIVAELDAQVVGWASLSPWSERLAYRETAESSFYVKSEYRGQGIGRKLKEAILEEARTHGFHVVLARVAEGSEASLHLNEACGFEHVGVMKQVGIKFGRRLDVHLMQKLIGPDRSM